MQIPRVLWTDHNLSDQARVAYGFLLSYAWQNDFCFPGQERLATDWGKTSRSVRSSLKELEQRGYLEIKQRGLGKTNIYKLFVQVKPKSKR